MHNYTNIIVCKSANSNGELSNTFEIIASKVFSFQKSNYVFWGTTFFSEIQQRLSIGCDFVQKPKPASEQVQ